MSALWIDLRRPDVAKINAALSVAHDEFDKTYFQSDTAADLTRGVTATIEALRIVLAAVAGAK